MGAGKSTGARSLAAGLGAEALDSDRELERRLGEPVESYFDREGEEAFRAREEELVLELLAREDALVVALGGGALGSEYVREALGRHTVVHLEVDPDEAWRRASGKGRPLARDRGRFDQLHGDRGAIYESVADAVLPPGDRDALRRALPALRALESAPGGTRLVWASAASGATKATSLPSLATYMGSIPSSSAAPATAGSTGTSASRTTIATPEARASSFRTEATPPRVASRMQ